MRVVVQRVSRARVTVEGRVAGEIAFGLMILLGVGREDTLAISASIAERVANLRIPGLRRRMIRRRPRRNERKAGRQSCQFHSLSSGPSSPITGSLFGRFTCGIVCSAFA